MALVPTGEALARLRESVPRIDQGYFSYGSGIIFSTTERLVPGAYILTNAHVVDGRGSIRVHFWDEDLSDFYPLEGSVVSMDSRLDIAVVYACCDRRLDGKAATFGSGAVDGAHVSTVGYPYNRNLRPTLTSGVISGSAVYRSTGVRLYLTDAPVNPGNSGGPLVLADGSVIGMVTAKRVGVAYEGQGLAIKVESLREHVSRLCLRRCDLPPGTDSSLGEE